MSFAYNLELTNSCNNRCIFCATEHHIAFRSMDQIRFEIFKAREDGCQRLDLTGGEPTIHPKIVEITALAKRLNFDVIYLKTNGRRLADKNFAKRLIDAGISEVLIAIHGHTPEIHDMQTGRKGSFLETVQAIKNCKELRVRVGTLTVITALNYMYLPEITTFMFENLRRDNHAFAYCYPTASSYWNFDRVVPWYRDVQSYLIESFKIMESAGAKANVDNVPLCIIPGYERCCNFLTTGGDLCHPVHEFGPRCNECIYYIVCDGMPPTYTKARGWDEFVPITEPMKETLLRPKDYKINLNQCLTMMGFVVEKNFGGVLYYKDMIFLTHKGVEIIRHFDGVTTIREIAQKFGDNGIKFALSIVDRGYALITDPHPGAIKQDPVARGFSYRPISDIITTNSEEFEYRLYRPLPSYPNFTLQ